MKIDNYKIVTGTLSTLNFTVRDMCCEGWIPINTPFRTGKQIIISGNPIYPDKCKYENEFGQVMIVFKEN